MLDNILDGVDYSQFPAELKAYYETQHRLALGISVNSTQRHKQKLIDLPAEKLPWYILSHHTDLGFQQATRGAKVHMRACSAQYEEFMKPSCSKKFKAAKEILPQKSK